MNNNWYKTETKIGRIYGLIKNTKAFFTVVSSMEVAISQAY